MAKVMTDESNYSAIAGAIRSKLGVSTRYKPSEMAAAIASIETGTDLTSADEGKVVVEDDGEYVLADQTSQTITQNGTYDTTTNNEVVVSVSGGGSQDDSFSLTQYIESSGTQWINTGYLVSEQSRFELVANVSSTNPSYASMFGARETAATGYSNLGAYFWAKYSGASSFVADFGSGQTAIDKRPPDNLIYDAKCVYGLKKHRASIRVQTLGEYVVYLNYSAAPTDQHPVYIFNLDQAGSEYGSDTRCTMKLYRFRVYEGNSLVMELLPYEDNGEACLRDSVTGNLFKNAGTGSFVLGTD